ARAIRQRPGTAGAKALEPLVARLLTNAGRATDVDDAFPRRAMQNRLDEAEALRHKRVGLPRHRAPPRGALTCTPAHLSSRSTAHLSSRSVQLCQLPA